MNLNESTTDRQQTNGSVDDTQTDGVGVRVRVGVSVSVRKRQCRRGRDVVDPAHMVRLDKGAVLRLHLAGWEVLVCVGVEWLSDELTTR